MLSRLRGNSATMNPDILIELIASIKRIEKQSPASVPFTVQCVTSMIQLYVVT